MATIRTCDVEGCGQKVRAKGLCSRHYRAAWEATDMGKAAQDRARARYQATDKGRATQARYKASDKGKATQASYDATPARRERRRMSVALRRARRAGAVIGWTPEDSFEAITLVYGKTCLTPGCSNPATDIDHVTALKREGDPDRGGHDIGNFQPLCGLCNAAKGASDTDHRPETSRLLVDVFARFMTAP